jgi:hypothetical protein
MDVDCRLDGADQAALFEFAELVVVIHRHDRWHGNRMGETHFFGQS